MTPDPTQKLFDYIALFAPLRGANDQLPARLKQCADLLARFTTTIPDPEAWHEMLDVFQQTIKAGEKILHRLRVMMVGTGDDREAVSFEEPLIANMSQVDAVTRLLIE